MKRQKLGQHFLRSDEVAKSIVTTAKITGDDVVLEIGPGRGVLTGHLCRLAKKVIAVEADRLLHEELKIRQTQDNLEIIYSDGFSRDMTFDILVSNLPYSQSRRAILWLSRQRFPHAVIMVQREFADKITATGQDRRAVSVLASWAFDIQVVRRIPSTCFEPPPKVDSVILLLRQRRRVTQEMIRAVNELFAQRRKTVRSMLRQLGVRSEDDRRLDELASEEIIRIAGTK